MTAFTISFHGPFHVGSGVPDRGLDRVLDRDALLPGTSLKGVMRAAASETLGMSKPLVASVFGSPSAHAGPALRHGSPWAWSDADFSEFSLQRLARIRIDDRTRTTDRGFLMLGETVWADTATFTVTQASPAPGNVGDHLLVLRAAARAVTSIGGGRSRGEGWVTITDEEPWSAQDTAHLRVLGGRQ